VAKRRAGKWHILSNEYVTKIPTHREQNAPVTQGLFTQGDHRSRFYECYRKEAEEYDKEFMKKYDEDLNTTLIFVSLSTVTVLGHGC